MRMGFKFRCGFPARPLAWVLAQALVLGSASAATQEERINELERKLDESLKVIEALKQEVRELKSEAARSQAPARPANEALVHKVNELEQQVSALSNRPDEDHGLDMHGFADVGFAASGAANPTGANIGRLDFYLTPKFTDRIKALFELNFECCTDGAIGTDLERMQIGYTASDWLTLWAGRFHTPFGYWNTAFHHGAQLQTSILRPKFLDFEDSGGILPVHTVGLWGTGAVKTGGGRFGYDLYVGNAPTIQMADPAMAGSGTLDPGLAGAGGRAASVGANLHYDLRGALEGLSLGVHVYSGRVKDTAMSADVTRLSFFGPWLAYLEDNWEVLGEQYNFRDQDESGASGAHSSSAGYLQVGRQFSGQWTPYLRYEYASLDQTDAYFARQKSGRSSYRWVGGLRYDLNPRTALKLEAQHVRLTDRDAYEYSQLLGQVAIRF